MTRLFFTVFGSFRVLFDERDITGRFRTDKEKALLLFLAQEQEHPHSRQQLAEMFWPNKPEGIARTNLRQALAGLRSTLGERTADTPCLLVTPDTVQFNPAVLCTIDAQDFLHRMQVIQRHAHPSLESCPVCAPLLEEAVGLYTGEYLSSISAADAPEFQEWVVFNREHYFRHLLTALQALSDWFACLPDYERAFRYARRLVSQAPLEENAHRQLMRLQALTGHRSAALEQYAACRRLLASELGTEPDPETTRLYEQIKSGQFPGKAHLPAGPHAIHLPFELTHFLGRETEMEWISGCLANPVCRLMTITGLPGSGKTRLALHAAGQNARSFPDGVHLVSLSDAAPSETLLSAIVQELKLVLAREHNAVDQLVQYLRPLNALLVLDGLERLIDQAWLLVEILRSAPGIKMIVTSRRRLNYQAACLLELPGLPYPVGQEIQKSLEFPAVKLFLARARRRQASCDPTKTCLKDIARIAQLCGGNPLAIELAAANLRDLSCGEIAHRLEADLDILRVTLDDVPLRHRDLQAIFAETLAMLTPDEEDTFRRLAIFSGSFDLAAAQVVAGVNPAALASLAQLALVERRTPQRYAWPPLAHRTALGLLAQGEAEAARLHAQHSHYYLELLHTAISTLRLDQSSGAACQWLQDDLPNIHQALRYGLERKLPSMAQSLLEIQFFDQILAGLTADQLSNLSQPKEQCADCAGFSPEESLYCAVAAGEICCKRHVGFDDMENALLLADSQGRVVDANYQAMQLSGYARDALQSMTLDQLVLANFAPAVQRELRHRTGYVRTQEGSRLPVDIRWETLVEADQRYLLLVLRPTSRTAKSRTRPGTGGLHERDPLTGLLNRAGFYRLLEERLAQPKVEGQCWGVVLLELNTLREINLEYGQPCGDKILQATSARLQTCVRNLDHVARVGGDEFAICICRLPKPAAMDSILQRLLAAFAEPFQVGEHTILATASAGVCIYSEEVTDFRDLLSGADQALSQAKQLGSNSFKIFTCCG